MRKFIIFWGLMSLLWGFQSCKKDEIDYTGIYTTTTKWEGNRETGTSELTETTISFSQRPFGSFFGQQVMPCAVDRDGNITIPVHDVILYTYRSGYGKTDGKTIELTITEINPDMNDTLIVEVTGWR